MSIDRMMSKWEKERRQRLGISMNDPNRGNRYKKQVMITDKQGKAIKYVAGALVATTLILYTASQLEDALLSENNLVSGDSRFLERPKICGQLNPVSKIQAKDPIDCSDGCLDSQRADFVDSLFYKEIPEELSIVDIVLAESGLFNATELVYESMAFKRVLSYEEDIVEIVSAYQHVDKNLALAVFKQETQGQPGLQRSRGDAIGPMQMTESGAFSHLYDMIFKEKTVHNGREVCDYHNLNLRNFYSAQLRRIIDHLQDNDLLVEPGENNYAEAKAQTWDLLVEHFDRTFFPGEYHVGLDIGCLYLDYLVDKVNLGRIVDVSDMDQREKEEIVLACYNAGPSMVGRTGGIPDNGQAPHYVEKASMYRRLLDEIDASQRDLMQESWDFLAENTRNYLAGRDAELQDQKRNSGDSYLERRARRQGRELNSVSVP